MKAFHCGKKKGPIGRPLPTTVGEICGYLSLNLLRRDRTRLDQGLVAVGVHQGEPEKQGDKDQSAEEHDDVKRLVMDHVHEEQDNQRSLDGRDS